MSLVKCTECGGDISDKALVCPHCGIPIQKIDGVEINSLIGNSSLQEKTKKTYIYTPNRILWIFVISVSIIGMFIFNLQYVQANPEVIPRLKFIVSQFISKNIGSAEEIKQLFNKKKTPSNLSTQLNQNAVPPNVIKQIELNPDMVIVKDDQKVFPAQYNNLWGHEFYTSKIDSTGDIDIGSEAKQQIAKLLNSLNFPTKLSKKILIINVDPASVTSKVLIKIPWAEGNYLNASQTEVGTHQGVYGGSVISINNLTGFDNNILTHELGHVIGSSLTETEWAQYYILRGIPKNTPLWLSDWSLSPGEDFAEVYLATYGSNNTYDSLMGIKTKYGLLMSNQGLENPNCSGLSSKLIKANIKRKYPDKTDMELSILMMEDSNLIKDATKAIQTNSELQKCRSQNNTSLLGGNSFGPAYYVRQVSDKAKKFIKDIVAKLNTVVCDSEEAKNYIDKYNKQKHEINKISLSESGLQSLALSNAEKIVNSTNTADLLFGKRFYYKTFYSNKWATCETTFYDVWSDVNGKPYAQVVFIHYGPFDRGGGGSHRFQPAITQKALIADLEEMINYNK